MEKEFFIRIEIIKVTINKLLGLLQQESREEE
jgi:hypothetical protein